MNEADVTEPVSENHRGGVLLYSFRTTDGVQAVHVSFLSALVAAQDHVHCLCQASAFSVSLSDLPVFQVPVLLRSHLWYLSNLWSLVYTREAVSESQDFVRIL